MQTVWKFPAPVAGRDDFGLFMPKNAEILTVMVQNDIPCVWAEVDDTQPTEKRYFRWAGTGYILDTNEYITKQYIGSVMMLDGALVFHLFECDKVNDGSH